VNDVSVLQAASEDKKIVDIAENIVRAIGFGKRRVINYQGKAVRTSFSNIPGQSWIYAF